MKTINTKLITKFKGKDSTRPIEVRIGILGELISTQEQLNLQNEVIDNLQGRPFLLRKEKEIYQEYRDSNKGITLGVFVNTKRGKKLIAQAILYTQVTDTRPSNESISDSIGRGLEVGNIMVHPDFLGNGLSGALIESAKTIVDTHEEIQADYLIFRVHVDNCFSYRSILRQEGSFIGRTETARFPGIEQEIRGVNIFCPLDIEAFSSKLEEKGVLQREASLSIILSSSTFTYRALRDKIDRGGEIITLEDTGLVSKKIEMRRRINLSRNTTASISR